MPINWKKTDWSRTAPGGDASTGSVLNTQGGAVASPGSSQFFREVVPHWAKNTDRFDKTIERAIRAKEGFIRVHIEAHGVRNLPAFALRGISCTAIDGPRADDHDQDPPSLSAWRDRGYLSAGGGNFFIFNPSSSAYDADQFLEKLSVSTASAVQYGGRAPFPVVLFVRMDSSFNVSANGGNDGIDGTFPYVLSLPGLPDQFLTNLPVGCVSTSANAREAEQLGWRVSGKICERIPEDHVLRRIGEDGLPGWAHPGKVYERDDAEQNALCRAVYAQVLETLCEEIRRSTGVAP